MTATPTRRLVHVGGQEIVLVDMDGIGRVMLVPPTVPMLGTKALKDGVARRRLTMIEGACPCGALLEVSASGARCEHEDDCPARDEVILAELTRLKR